MDKKYTSLENQIRNVVRGNLSENKNNKSLESKIRNVIQEDLNEARRKSAFIPPNVSHGVTASSEPYGDKHLPVVTTSSGSRVELPHILYHTPDLAQQGAQTFIDHTYTKQGNDPTRGFPALIKHHQAHKDLKEAFGRERLNKELAKKGYNPDVAGLEAKNTELLQAHQEATARALEAKTAYEKLAQKYGITPEPIGEEVDFDEALGTGGNEGGEFKGTPAAFFKSFHIEPKVGDAHPPASGAAASSRNRAKIASSETMNTTNNGVKKEGYIITPRGRVALGENNKAKGLDDLIKRTLKIEPDAKGVGFAEPPKTMHDIENIPVATDKDSSTAVTVVSPTAPKKQENIPNLPANSKTGTDVVTPGDIKTPKPGVKDVQLPVVKEPTSNSKSTELAPTMRQERGFVPNEPSSKALEIPNSKSTELAPTMRQELGFVPKQTPSTEIQPHIRSVFDTPEPTAPRIKAPERPVKSPNPPGPPRPPGPPKPPEVPPGKKKFRLPEIPGLNLGGGIIPGFAGAVDNPSGNEIKLSKHRHWAKDYITFGYIPDNSNYFGEDADAERSSIENVGRPNSKNKLTKNAEIQRKIIEDTQRRKAVILRAKEKNKNGKEGANPNIDTKPELKHVHVHERIVSKWTTGGAAAGLGATTGPSLDKATERSDEPVKNPNLIQKTQQTLDRNNPLLDPNAEPYGGKDLTADVLSMVPLVNIPASAYSTYRDLKRGDYVSAAADAAGIIPGVSDVTHGAKLLGKLGIAGAKAFKASSIPSKITKTMDTVNHVGHALNSYQLGDAGRRIYNNRDAIAKNIANKATDAWNHPGETASAAWKGVKDTASDAAHTVSDWVGGKNDSNSAAANPPSTPSTQTTPNKPDKKIDKILNNQSVKSNKPSSYIGS